MFRYAPSDRSFQQVFFPSTQSSPPPDQQSQAAPGLPWSGLRTFEPHEPQTLLQQPEVFVTCIPGLSPYNGLETPHLGPVLKSSVLAVRSPLANSPWMTGGRKGKTGRGRRDM